MLKIMVVDDEENVRYVVESLVKKSGLGLEFVYQASDGDEGFEKCVQLKTDIVVADIRMPGIDGLEMLRRIRLTCPAVEVIVISGYSDFAYAQSALQNGALAYLLKPIDEEEFYDALRRARTRIEKKRTEQTELNKLRLTVRKLQSEFDKNDAPAPEDLPPGASTQFINALAYLQENYASDISLESTANQVFMSPAYLSALCKKHLGRAFVDYLNYLRVRKAGQLLERTDLRVNEVAGLVGFREVSYFIRVFRKYTGMSPTQYRRTGQIVRERRLQG